MTLTVSSSFALQAAPDDRAAARREAQRQFQAMSDAMVKEKGLLNHAQAGLLLDVSTKRVGELVRLGKLTDFSFLGRKYVSMREIWERNQQNLKTGRPPRPTGERLTAQVKAALKHDALQMRQGGFQGPYQKSLRETKKQRETERKTKAREKRKAVLKAILQGGKP